MPIERSQPETRRDLAIQLLERQDALPSVFVPKDQGRSVVANPQQVCGEIKPGTGKPSRTWHAIAVDQNFLPSLTGHDLAEVPDGRPELLAVFDGPCPKGMVVCQLDVMPFRGELRESRHTRPGNPFGRRRP